MKVKGNEKMFENENDEEVIDHKHEHGHEEDYQGGVQKIKTAIGKMRKQEDSQYKHHDAKRFKRK